MKLTSEIRQQMIIKIKPREKRDENFAIKKPINYVDDELFSHP